MLAEKVDKWIAAYKAEGRAEGKAEGKEEGKAEGRAEGIVEGRAEGKTEGRREGMATILRRMKEAGMSVADIAQITGMPEEEVRHLI